MLNLRISDILIFRDGYQTDQIPLRPKEGIRPGPQKGANATQRHKCTSAVILDFQSSLYQAVHGRRFQTAVMLSSGCSIETKFRDI